LVREGGRGTEAERNKNAVRTFVAAVNAQDWDRLDQVVAANFVRHSHAALVKSGGQSWL
jgi:predicted ester cyclase